MTENATTVPEGIRCSDAEREQVRKVLCGAAGEGRLTMDEVEGRLGQLEGMRYRHELASLTADLPAAEPAVLAGWREILAAARTAFVADVAVLFGRAAAPTPGRRRVLVLLTVLIGLMMAAAIVAGALHGFGGDGLDGPDAIGHVHRH